MRLCMFAAILSASSFLAFAGDPAPQIAPQMTDISQKAAKPGDLVTVSGVGLNAKNIDEIYLTDHKFDLRVKVLDQKDTAVQFRVPPFAKPGRMQLLFLTKSPQGEDPKLLEQPVYLLIEDPEAEVVVAKAAPDSSKKESAKAEDSKPETKDAPKSDTAPVDQTKPILAKPDSTKQDPRQPNLI